MPLAEPQALAREAVLGLAAGLPIGTDISRLQQVFEAPGQSSAQQRSTHDEWR